jgi:hypothetical protein
MKTADGGDGNLPMPWHNTALMSEEDIRATWKYVHSLGPALGDRIPRNTKPGIDPKEGKYVDLTQKSVPAIDTTKKP